MKKTGEHLVTGPVPTTRVVGFIDMIDEDEELSYIDDGTPTETTKKESSALKIFDAKTKSTMGKGESSGLKLHDPIDLDPSEAEKPTADQSRSPLRCWEMTISRLQRPLERTWPHSS
jgi:hypothetical protein